MIWGILFCKPIIGQKRLATSLVNKTKTVKNIMEPVIVEPKNSAGLSINLAKILPTADPCFLLSSMFNLLALTNAISIPEKNIMSIKEETQRIIVQSIK